MNFGPKQAWLYAAQWGSAMTNGDPGAIMYSFDERFEVDSEEHRTDALEYVAEMRGFVVAKPADYDADELDKLDALTRALKLAPVTYAPSDLDEFTEAYIEAIFFTECEFRSVEYALSEEDSVWEPENDSALPGDLDARHLAPATLAKIKADCAAFQAQAADMLAEADTRGFDLAHAGHDFWLTRNGHGAGFWDRTELQAEGDEYERLTTIMVEAGHDSNAWNKACTARSVLSEASLGERLSKLARGFGEVDSYLGDDGRVYQ